jgi:hypothetical protein
MNNSQVQKNFVTVAPVTRTDIKLTETVKLPDGHNSAFQMESSQSKSDPKRLTVRYKNLRSMLDELIVLYNVVNKAQSSLNLKFDYLKFKIHIETRQETWHPNKKFNADQLIEDKTLFFGKLTNMCQAKLIFEIFKMIQEDSWPKPPALPILLKKFLQLIENMDPESHEDELENICQMSLNLLREIEKPSMPHSVPELLFDSQDVNDTLQPEPLNSFFENSTEKYPHYDSNNNQRSTRNLGPGPGNPAPIPSSAFQKPNRTYSTPPKHQISSNPFEDPDTRSHSTQPTPFDEASPPRELQSTSSNPFGSPPRVILKSNNPFENSPPRPPVEQIDPLWGSTPGLLPNNQGAMNAWQNTSLKVPEASPMTSNDQFNQGSNCLIGPNVYQQTGPSPSTSNGHFSTQNPYSGPQSYPDLPKREVVPPISPNPYANQNPYLNQNSQANFQPKGKEQTNFTKPTPTAVPNTKPVPTIVTQPPSKPVGPVHKPIFTGPNSRLENSRQPIPTLPRKENPVPIEQIVEPTIIEEKKAEIELNVAKPANHLDKPNRKDKILEKLPEFNYETCWKFRKFLYLRGEGEKNNWLEALVSESITKKLTNYKILDFLFRFNNSSIHDTDAENKLENKRMDPTEIINTYQAIMAKIKERKSPSYDPYNLTSIVGQLEEACPETKTHFAKEFIDLLKKNVYKVQETSFDKYIEMYLKNPDSVIPQYIFYTLASSNYSTFREKLGANTQLKEERSVLLRKVLSIYERLKDHFGTETAFEKHLITVTNLLSQESNAKFKKNRLLSSKDAADNILKYIEQYKGKETKNAKETKEVKEAKGNEEAVQNRPLIHINFTAYAFAYSFPKENEDLKQMFDHLRSDFQKKILDQAGSKREEYHKLWMVLKDKISRELNKDFPEEIIAHLKQTWSLSKDSNDKYESSNAVSERIDELMSEGKDHEFATLPIFLIQQKDNKRNEIGTILEQYKNAITSWYNRDIVEMKITKSRAKNLQTKKLEENLKFWLEAFKMDLKVSSFKEQWAACCQLLKESDRIDQDSVKMENFGFKLELLKCPMDKQDPELNSYNLYAKLEKECPKLFKMTNLKGSKAIESFVQKQFKTEGMNMNLLRKAIDEFSEKWRKDIQEWSSSKVDDQTIVAMEELTNFDEELLVNISAFLEIPKDRDHDLIKTIRDTCLIYQSLINFKEFQETFTKLDQFFRNQKDAQKYVGFSKEDFEQIKKASNLVISEKKLTVNYTELSDNYKNALILFRKERTLFDIIVPCLELINHFMKIKNRNVHMSMLKEKTDAAVTNEGILDLIRLINYWDTARTPSKPNEQYTIHRIMSNIREMYNSDLRNLKSSKSKPLDLVLIMKNSSKLISSSVTLLEENLDVELEGILSKGRYTIEIDSEMSGQTYTLRCEVVNKGSDTNIPIDMKKLLNFHRIISAQANQGHESESMFQQEKGDAFLEIFGALNKARRLLENLRSTGNILNLTKAIETAKLETNIRQIELKPSEFQMNSKEKRTTFINLDEDEFQHCCKMIEVEKTSVKINFEMKSRMGNNQRKEEITGAFPFHILCQLLLHIEEANKKNIAQEASDKQTYWITYLEGRQKEFLATYTWVYLSSLPPRKQDEDGGIEDSEIIHQHMVEKNPAQRGELPLKQIELADRDGFLFSHIDETLDKKAEAILKFVRKDLEAHRFKQKIRELPIYLDSLDCSFSNNILTEVSPVINDGEEPKKNRANETGRTRKFHYYPYKNKREEEKENFNFRLDVFFACVEKTETEIKQLRPYNILLLNQDTLFIQIKTFLERAFYDPSGSWYFILDFHLLSVETRAEFISFSRSLIKSEFGSRKYNYNLLLLIDEDSLKGSILDEITRKAQDILMKPSWNIQDRKSETVMRLLQQVPITLVTSKIAGLGKSYYIKKKARGNLVRLFLSGDISERNIEKRLGRLAHKLQEEDSGNISLHLKMDMMENMMKNCERLDQLLFRILFLKYSPFGESYLFFDKVDHFYVEISNNYRDFLLKELTIFSIFTDLPDKRVHIQGISFESEIERDGVMPIDLNELQGPRDEKDVSENRIFYICRAHQMLKDHRIQTNEIWSADDQSRNEHSPETKRNWLLTLKDIFKGGRNLEGNMTQLVSLIKNLFDDLKAYGGVHQISVDTLKIAVKDRADSTYINSLKSSRSDLLKLIFDSNVELVWSTVEFIRGENRMTKEFRDTRDRNRKDTLRTELKNLLAQYQKDISNLPNFKSWDREKKVISFIHGGSVKILSRDLTNINEEVRKFFKFASDGQDIHDLQKFELQDGEGRKKLELAGGQANRPAPNFIEEKYTSNFTKKECIFTKRNFQVFIIDELKNFFDIRGRDNTIEEDIRNFGNKKGYAFTCDNYIKILMILKRVSSRLPVVISGATGCGKSYLIEFIAKCLFKNTDRFEMMTLHSGVSEEELEDFLAKAVEPKEEMGGEQAKNGRIWIFFDEFNTSPLQSLIEEIISENRASFTRREIKFPSNVVFIAACNPFRIRANPSVVGLRPNATNFSHRVYPIPESLINFTWDFDQLSYESEWKYADQMLKNNEQLQRYKEISPMVKGEAVITIAIECIMAAQKYHRSQDGESTVSLRDITRFVPLFVYFTDLHNNEYFTSLINAINLIYILRIPDQDSKDRLDSLLSKTLQEQCLRFNVQEQLNSYVSAFPEVTKDKFFIRVFRDLSKTMIEEIMRDNIQQLDPNREYILNIPLIENMYTFFACLANNIPCVACGKPGSSKSLGLTLCREILNLSPEIKSRSRFLVKMMKSIEVKEYWGNALTTSLQVKAIFDEAEKQFKTDREKNVSNKQYAISMDELGLAEIADDNPLKILHPLLDNLNGMGFIGLSNWVMDVSKMNRVLLISRNELTEADLSDIGKINVSLDEIAVDKPMIQLRMQCLVKAYTEFIKQERGMASEGKVDYLSNFFGARDLYGAVKYLNKNIVRMFQIHGEYNSIKKTSLKDEDIFDLLVSNAIDRNFSGKQKLKSFKSAWEMNNIYYKLAKGTDYPKKRDPDVLSMIGQNLISDYSRHLMLFYDNPTTSKLLIDSLKGFIKNNLMTNETKIKVLIGITEEGEITDIINSLEVWISEGYTLIMKDMDRVYDCLYEILNLKYNIVEGNANCTISVNNRRVPVKVDKKFRCIVLMKQEDSTEKRTQAESQLPPPFLNRFEKHLVLLKDMFSTEEARSIEKVKNTVLPPQPNKEGDFDLKDLKKCSRCIHNFSDELISSVIIDQDELMKRNKLKIRSDEYYLRQLIEEKCNKDFSKGFKPMTPDEIKLKEKKASEALVELYSKNMLFYQTMVSKVANNEMEKRFIASHPDSLEKFMEPLISKGKIQKYLIFTFSRNIELVEAIQRVRTKLNKKTTDQNRVTIHSISIEDISKKTEDNPTSNFDGARPLIENSVKSKTFTIIKFTDQGMWKQMDKIREIVDSVTIPTNHFLFFIGMYSIEKDSLTEVQDKTSPITFSVANWKMVVIDNVYDSNYQRFMKIMRNKDKRHEPMIPREILMEDCSKHRNSRIVQLILGEIKQKLIQSNINPREILTLLKEKGSETIFSFIGDSIVNMSYDRLEDKSILEWVCHPEYKELLLNNIDIDDVISDILEKIFFGRIKKSIAVIHQKKGFGFLSSIYNSGELSSHVKKRLLEYWIDDVKSLTSEDFQKGVSETGLEAPAMIKVFNDIIESNRKDFIDIYDEVSKTKDRESSFSSLRMLFETSSQDQEAREDLGEASPCRAAIFDMFQLYIQKIQVYLPYKPDKLEYDTGISIYIAVVLLEHHCRSRHARWEPITKSLMFRLGMEYCKIYLDTKNTPVIPTDNIVHAIFAFRYLFDKEIETLEENPNLVEAAFLEFSSSMFLSFNRRKIQISVKPFQTEGEYGQIIKELKSDQQAMTSWGDGSKSLPKYSADLLLSIYESIAEIQYKSKEVWKSFMPKHNKELITGSDSSKLIRITHQFLQVLKAIEIDSPVSRLTETITTASKIITYCNVDPKDTSDLVLYIFEIFTSKQKFFSKKHYENLMTVASLIADQLQITVSTEGKIVFVSPKVSDKMLQELDKLFEKNLKDKQKKDPDGEIDLHVKIYNRMLNQMAKQLQTKKQQKIEYSTDQVEELFKQFTEVSEPIKALSFQAEELLRNLNYLVLIQSAEDGEDDEEERIKRLADIDSVLIDTEGNISPHGLALGKELYDQGFKTHMKKLTAAVKELNSQWKFTFLPNTDYAGRATVESLNKNVSTQPTKPDPNFSKYKSSDVPAFVQYTAYHFEKETMKLILDTKFYQKNSKKPIVFFDEKGADPYSQEFLDQVDRMENKEKCTIFMMQLCFTLAQKSDTKVLKTIERCYQVLKRLSNTPDDYRAFIFIQLAIQKLSGEIKQGIDSAAGIRLCINKSKEITAAVVEKQIETNPYFDQLKKKGELSKLYLISKLIDNETEYPIQLYKKLFGRERKVAFNDLLSHLVTKRDSIKYGECIRMVEISELYSEYKEILLSVLKFCRVLKKNLNGKLKQREGDNSLSKWIGGEYNEKIRKKIVVVKAYNPFEDEADAEEEIEFDNPDRVKYQELSECYQKEFVTAIQRLKSILQTKHIEERLKMHFENKLSWGSRTNDRLEFLDRVTNSQESLSSFLVREEETSDTDMRGLISSLVALQNKLVEGASEFFNEEYRILVDEHPRGRVEFMNLRAENLPELKGIKSTCLQHARYTYSPEGTPQIDVELGEILKKLLPRLVPKISFDSPTFYFEEDLEKLEIDTEAQKFLRRHRIDFQGVNYRELQNLCDNLNIETNELENCELLLMRAMQDDKLQSLDKETRLSDLIGQDNLGEVALENLPVFIQFLNIKRFDKSSFQPLHQDNPFDEDDPYFIVFKQSLNLLSAKKRGTLKSADLEQLRFEMQQSLYDLKSMAFVSQRSHEKQKLKKEREETDLKKKKPQEVDSLQRITSPLHPKLIEELNEKIAEKNRFFFFTDIEDLEFVSRLPPPRIYDHMKVCELFWIISALLNFLGGYKLRTK